MLRHLAIENHGFYMGIQFGNFQSPSSMKIIPGAIILAAGRSSRMGRPKMVLPWGETSILGHLITQWGALGARQIGVVCANDDMAVGGELERLKFPVEQRIFNTEPERGMFSSIQCAAHWPGWLAELTHWVLVLGDQPHLREDTLRRLLEFSTAHPESICQPIWSGRRRHPVVLPGVAFAKMAGSEARDLKEFLQSFEIAGCELADEGLGLDIDRPDDYDRAKLQASICKPQ